MEKKLRTKTNIVLSLTDNDYAALTEGGSLRLSGVVTAVYNDRKDELADMPLYHPPAERGRSVSVDVDLADTLRQIAHDRFTSIAILTYSMMKPQLGAGKPAHREITAHNSVVQAA